MNCFTKNLIALCGKTCSILCQRQNEHRVRIKTRISHIFMKNELRVFFIRKADYPSFAYVTIPLHSLVASNLRHLDVVSAKTGLTPCGLDPVFVLTTKATRWCPRESTQS